MQLLHTLAFTDDTVKTFFIQESADKQGKNRIGFPIAKEIVETEANYKAY